MLNRLIPHGWLLHMSFAFPMLLLIFHAMELWPAAIAAEVKQAGPQELSGVGLLLFKGETDNYPTVIQIVPGSSAEKDGRLRPGDQILEISPTGDPQRFTSLASRPTTDVFSMLQGPIDSTIILKVRQRQGSDGSSSNIIVRLTRTRLSIPAQLPTNYVTRDLPIQQSIVVLRTNSRSWLTNVSRQNSMTNKSTALPKAAESFVQPDSAAWSKIIIGMPKEEVLMLLGQPRERVEVLPFAEVTTIWVYGWLAFASEVFPSPYYFKVYFQNGKVLEKEDPFGNALSFDGFPTRPTLITPSMNQVFDHYPRFMDLRWAPSSGRYPIEYVIELELQIPNGWTTNEFRTERPYYCVEFGGASDGRWRVKAKNQIGESDWCDFRNFKFTK